MYDPLEIASARVQMIEEVIERATNENAGLYADDDSSPEASGREDAAYWLLDMVQGYFLEPLDIIEALKELLGDKSNREEVDTPTDDSRDYEAATEAFFQEILALVNAPLPATREEALTELLTPRLEAVKTIATRISEHSIGEYGDDYHTALDTSAKVVASLVLVALNTPAKSLQETADKVYDSLLSARSLAEDPNGDNDEGYDQGLADGYVTVANSLISLIITK